MMRITDVMPGRPWLRRTIVCVCLGIGMLACSDDGGADAEPEDMAATVKAETLRAWEGYKQYAWGMDEFKPLSKTGSNWYDLPLSISPIDAYSTLRVMGLDEEAREVERYVETLQFDKDISVSVFETNIRVLGGLLSMYQYTNNPKILAKARDVGDRLLPAFNSETGVPYSSINLKTGQVGGDGASPAGAGTYTLEFGLLSYYTQDPIYYKKAKQAMKVLFDRRSEIDLIGSFIHVNSGDWLSGTSHISAGSDSYYEYLIKTWLLFKDPEMKAMWDVIAKAVVKHNPETLEGRVWYGPVDMHTGARAGSSVTLYDAFFPATLAVGGYVTEAATLQDTWDWLWNKYGLEPLAYNYKSNAIEDYTYDLNPEIVESAYYLYHFTKDARYKAMAAKYFSDVKQYCRTDVAYTKVDNVVTKKQGDALATFFFAETMKYFYLVFSEDAGTFDFDDYVFNTEAHTFRKSLLDQQIVNDVLLKE